MTLKSPSSRPVEIVIPPAIADKIEALLEADFQEKWELAKQIYDEGEAVIPYLIDLLQDDSLDWEVRWFAARILGGFDRPEVVSSLVEMLIDLEDEELSQSIADSLTQIGPTAVVALSRLLADGEQRTRAVIALARIRHVSTVLPLLTIMAGEEANLRAIALEALGSFHDERVQPALFKALEDPSGSVRQEAVKILGLRQDLQQQCDVVALLEPRLWDANLAVCQQATISLGRVGNPAAIAALVYLLSRETTPEKLGLTAIQSLGWIAHPAATQALITTWDRATWKQRMAIVAALEAQLNEAQPSNERPAVVITALLRWSTTLQLTPDREYRSLRQALALALGRLGNDTVIPHLQKLSQDGDQGVRLHAIAALRQLIPPDVDVTLDVEIQD